VNAGDVRVIERCQHLRLAAEARQPVVEIDGWPGRGQQDLDRHVAAERRIMRAIDLAHPAPADQADDAEVAGEGVARLPLFHREPRRGIQNPMRRGVGAQHAPDDGQQRRVAAARLLHVPRPIAVWHVQGGLEDGASPPKLIRIVNRLKRTLAHPSLPVYSS
jgi:hypothetical protein